MCVAVFEELALALRGGLGEEGVEEAAPATPEALSPVWAAGFPRALSVVAEDVSTVMEIHPCLEREVV